MPGDYVVIYFIDDEEFKDIKKNARRKLEIPMPAAMSCKIYCGEVAGETCRAIGGHKTHCRKSYEFN